MGTKHKHYDVIVAWAAGEEIEYRLDPNDSWLSIVDPSWNSSTEYRIKPKRVKKEGWVNVYPDKYAWHITAKTEFHFNKEHADRMATKDRVACIRIEWEEEE
jgi:hypothetical protein